LKQIDRICKPDEAFFVCDAMTGQDAVNSAKAFNDALDLNGVILTKLDGDARGGGCPVDQGSHQGPDQVHRRRREARPPRRVPSRTHGPAHHGPGRCDGPDRKGPNGSRASSVRKRSSNNRPNWPRAISRSTIFAKQFSQLAQMGNMKEIMAQMPAWAT